MAIHAASAGATAAAIRATGVSAFKELRPLSLQREREKGEWGGGGVGEVVAGWWVKREEKEKKQG